VRIAWTRELPSPPLGLSLARESGAVLTFDAERAFTRLDALGQVDLRKPSPATVTAAALSDEGKHVAALGRRGQAWLLSAEFDVIWQRSLSPRPVALAIDHQGQVVAVADEAGGLHVFDALGQEVWRAATPRPLVHLAYVPEGGALVGAADLGLVCAFDRRGHLLWREGLMANVGSLAVSGSGELIVLACFSEGLRRCALQKPRLEKPPQGGPCRLAAVGYRGDVVLCAGTDSRLILFDAAGATKGEMTLPAAPSALALAALGERAVVTADRAVIGVDLTRSD
jgi:hypothetical protein